MRQTAPASGSRRRGQGLSPLGDGVGCAAVGGGGGRGRQARGRREGLSARRAARATALLVAGAARPGRWRRWITVTRLIICAVGYE